jgi:hypothetical protein
MYLGQGRITEDKIPKRLLWLCWCSLYEGLQDLLIHIGRKGYRHHVSITEDG